MKKLLTFFLACILALSMTACGGDDNPKNETIEVNVNLDTNITADLEILIPGGNENEITMIDCLIESFAEIYPNVSIEKAYVSVSNYVSQVGNMQLGNVLPDIVWSNSPDFYDLVESDTFIDLTPYIEASEKEATLNSYLGEDGQPAKFSYSDFYGEFFDMASAYGKKYVIPRSADSVVTFINTDILSKAGVDLNPETTKVKNGWTWDDFMDVCAQVRTYMDNNGMANCYVLDANLTSWLSCCYPMLVSYGAEVLDENGELAIDSAATRECLAMVKEMVDKRYIIDSTQATNNSFENGKGAMLFQSASVSLYADKKVLQDKVDLVSFPLIMDNNTPKIGAGVAGYAINSASDNKDIAWAFLAHLLSYQGQQNMANNGLNLASIRKDLADPTVANWGKKYSNLNLSAYTYGSEYKISADFFIRTELTAKAGLELAIKQMFNKATNAEKAKDPESIIRDAVRDMQDAMISY